MSYVDNFVGHPGNKPDYGAVKSRPVHLDRIQDGPQELPPPTSFLESAQRQAEEHTARLWSICQRLESLHERAFGGEPKSGEGRGEINPASAGAVHKLADAMRPHEMLVDRIDEIITKLDPLA